MKRKEAPDRFFDEADLLPLSRLADLEFCERRAALHLIEMVWEDNVHTAEGAVIHQRAHGDESPEKRGGLVIVRGLWLRSLRLGLSGKADIVEFHRADDADAMGAVIPGYSGRWMVYPVEYKPGRLRHQRSFQIQLCAQTLCLEEMLRCVVQEGALFYGKNRRRQVVRFDDQLRRETEETAIRLHELVRSGRTPSARYEKKCDSCSLMHLCLPKVAGAGRSVGSYFARMLAD
ncbi:MAG: CRISPR-associated protein Cas4 [Desulfobulbaceae bacterium DB1]|nr:MAG: CRISPR-associated protein Cas4 [Desulfobulbaceae bacterium DB1]